MRCWKRDFSVPLPFGLGDAKPAFGTEGRDEWGSFSSLGVWGGWGGGVPSGSEDPGFLEDEVFELGFPE